MHAWLARGAAQGMEGFTDRPHPPTPCPHQMPVVVEAEVLEMRWAKPYWGVSTSSARSRGHRRRPKHRAPARKWELALSFRISTVAKMERRRIAVPARRIPKTLRCSARPVVGRQTDSSSSVRRTMACLLVRSGGVS